MLSLIYPHIKTGPRTHSHHNFTTASENTSDHQEGRHTDIILIRFSSPGSMLIQSRAHSYWCTQLYTDWQGRRGACRRGSSQLCYSTIYTFQKFPWDKNIYKSFLKSPFILIYQWILQCVTVSLKNLVKVLNSPHTKTNTKWTYNLGSGGWGRENHEAPEANPLAEN